MLCVIITLTIDTFYDDVKSLPKKMDNIVDGSSFYCDVPRKPKTDCKCFEPTSNSLFLNKICISRFNSKSWWKWNYTCSIKNLKDVESQEPKNNLLVIIDGENSSKRLCSDYTNSFSYKSNILCSFFNIHVSIFFLSRFQTYWFSTTNITGWQSQQML